MSNSKAKWWEVVGSVTAIASALVAFYAAWDASQSGGVAEQAAERAATATERLANVTESALKAAEMSAEAATNLVKTQQELVTARQDSKSLEATARILEAWLQYGESGYASPETLNGAIRTQKRGLLDEDFATIAKTLSRRALHLSTFMELRPDYRAERDISLLGALDNSIHRYNERSEVEFRSNADEIWRAFQSFLPGTLYQSELGKYQVVRQIVTDAREIRADSWNELAPAILLIHLNAFDLSKGSTQRDKCLAWKTHFVPFLEKLDRSIPLLVYTRTPYKIGHLAWILQELPNTTVDKCNRHKWKPVSLDRKGIVGFLTILNKPKDFGNQVHAVKLFKCAASILGNRETQACEIHRNHS